MFSAQSKILTTAVVFPLMFAFLIKGCARQQGQGASQPVGAASKMDDVKVGTWGGEHVRLEVGAGGAEIEFDCGHGTIDEKLAPDRQGRFDARGTHVREHGGPVRKDETPDSHPAQFKGEVKGDRMTLTVTETDTHTSLGTFTLTYGGQAKLMKCR
jgi:hypothetical protein